MRSVGGEYVAGSLPILRRQIRSKLPFRPKLRMDKDIWGRARRRQSVYPMPKTSFQVHPALIPLGGLLGEMIKAGPRREPGAKLDSALVSAVVHLECLDHFAAAKDVPVIVSVPASSNSPTSSKLLEPGLSLRFFVPTPNPAGYHPAQLIATAYDGLLLSSHTYPAKTPSCTVPGRGHLNTPYAPRSQRRLSMLPHFSPNIRPRGSRGTPEAL